MSTLLRSTGAFRRNSRTIQSDELDRIHGQENSPLLAEAIAEHVGAGVRTPHNRCRYALGQRNVLEPQLRCAGC
jgi:hypothetical protein